MDILPMKHILLAFCFLLLVACAWNPVMTPHAFRVPAGSSQDSLATIYGVSNGDNFCFRKINGNANLICQ